MTMMIRLWEARTGKKQAVDISLTYNVRVFGRFPHSTFKLYVHAKSQPSRTINGRNQSTGSPTYSLHKFGFLTDFGRFFGALFSLKVWGDARTREQVRREQVGHDHDESDDHKVYDHHDRTHSSVGDDVYDHVDDHDDS